MRPYADIFAANPLAHEQPPASRFIDDEVFLAQLFGDPQWPAPLPQTSLFAYLFYKWKRQARAS